ncbi:MAG: hypothetical protein CBC53_004405 [Alphaproteobacteria bacterium TMED93]|nr:MAG: hypothetical protein CBC53_004405 [Alphaproteobacteria bacterium TMED93]
MKIITKIIIIAFNLFYITSLFSFEFEDVIKKTFSNKKLDSIEGLWQKTYANQGSTGCITMFYKTKENLFNQIHIDSCFVIDKVTGRQRKINENYYEGENAIYFYDRNSTWSPSNIKISKNLNTFSITHEGQGNTFTEQWKRVWPEDLIRHNQNLEN